PAPGGRHPPGRWQPSRKGPGAAARCERRCTARGRRSRWFTRRETSARPTAGAVPFGPAITSPQPRAARPGRGGPAASRSTRARRRRRHTGPFPSSPRRGMVPPMTNLFSIDGKVALVTGGSRGIGLMIARGFVEAGARTYISSRKADVCDQVAAELSRQGTCVSLPADLSSEAGARSLADTLARQNITVTAIAPGPFESKMMHETLERFRDAIIASCPLGRIGEPEDLAGAAIYLASRAGAYLTGAVIPVDGGITTRHA